MARGAVQKHTTVTIRVRIQVYGNHGANIPGLIPACPTQIASGGITLTGAAKRSLDERLM